jgi:hypothetical protein
MRAPRRCRVSVLRGNLYSCWPLYTGWRLHVHRTAICCLSRMNEFFLRSRGGGGWNWVGVVSGLLNPNDSGVSAQERRPHHGERHHEGGGCRRRRFAFRQLGGDDKAREWRGAALPAYQRRTRAADALIAGAYLAGFDVRLPRRFRARSARMWSAGPGARSMETGTPATRVRSSTSRSFGSSSTGRSRATSVSLLVALGVRADGQKVLLTRALSLPRSSSIGTPYTAGQRS